MSSLFLRHPRIGILGGGQLARMIALAARPLGLDVDVFAPGPHVPAAPVADRWIDADYLDLDRVRAFAREVDVVTCEFENVPALTAEVAAACTRVAPRAEVLAIAQDRVREKRAFETSGVPIADFVEFVAGGARPAAPGWSDGGVLKTATGGYDGKGQARVASFGEACAVWESWHRPAAVLERFVEFESELSVIVARGTSGDIAVYEPCANRHVDHILDVTVMPAPLSDVTLDRARHKARAVAEALEVVGLLCVEMFVLADGHLVVNEIAPRPHNSGHVTLDACVTSQFEQLLRAILGWPLGSVAMRAPAAASANLMGQLWTTAQVSAEFVLSDPEVKLHLYGKHEPRPGRKMGHVNALGATADEAERRAREARRRLSEVQRGF